MTYCRSALSAREEAVAAREAEAKEAELKARALEEGVKVRSLEAERLRETLSGLEKGLEGEKADLAKRKVYLITVAGSRARSLEHRFKSHIKTQTPVLAIPLAFFRVHGR